MSSRPEFTYNLRHYGSMLRDRIRVDAYLSALRRAITPGCTVADIGTGTGFFAVFACQAGAGKVYAIDPNDSILIAKEIAAANGVAEKIEFLQVDSTEVVLPQKADVLVSDLRGIIPLFGQHLNTIQDARQRLLAVNGIQIPQKDELFIVGVEDQIIYDRATAAAKSVNDISMLPMLSYLKNNWMSLDSCEFPNDDNLLTTDAHWHTIDYTTHKNSNVEGHAQLVVQRSGTLHGYLVWFRATLLDGIQYDTRPKPDYQVYGHLFFPLNTPVPLVQGDQVDVELKASLMGPTYTWRWTTHCPTANQTTARKQQQSTFFGSPMSAGDLKKRASDQSPNKNDKGEATMLILSDMDGNHTLQEIASELLVKFPNQFSDLSQALGFVGDVAMRFGK